MDEPLTSMIRPAAKPAAPAYPCLRRSTAGSVGVGTVVLFTAPTQGTVVHSICDDMPLGYRTTTWQPDFFEDFDGSVTLGPGSLIKA